jgi:hypothetical protein
MKIQSFLLSVALVSFATTSYSQCQTPEVSYNLDANTQDAQVNQMHAVNFGATPTVDRFGMPNSAYAFSGSNNYIEFPSDFDYNSTTINLWFKAESSNTSPKTIYDNDNPGLVNGSRKMYVMNDGGIPSVYFSTGAGTTNVHTEPISMNVWYMATLVVDSDVKYYLNGNLVATFALHGSNSTAGSPFAHLGCTRLIDRFFDGDIDDLLIYDCALNASQIMQLYNDSQISGVIFHDFNENCINEMNEAGLNDRLAVINPGNIIVETNSNGVWSVDSLPAGNYTITYDVSGNWEATCATSQNFTVIHPDSTTIVPSFGLISTQPCTSPNVTVSMPFIRRCFTNQKIYVQA